MAGPTVAFVAHRMDEAGDLGSANASFRSIAAIRHPTSQTRTELTAPALQNKQCPELSEPSTAIDQLKPMAVTPDHHPIRRFNVDGQGGKNIQRPSSSQET